MENKLSKEQQLDMLVMHFAKGKKNQFARILSISPQNLNSWLKNGYIDIERVFKSCDGVSAEWLITGKGEMLKKDNARTEEPERTNKEESAAPAAVSQEPCLRCTTIFGNTAVIKLSNVQEMTYNEHSRLAIIFTNRQQLITPMSPEEFENLYEATTTLNLPPEK